MNEKREKWTKGPWKVQKDADAYTHIVRDVSEKYIAACVQSDSDEVRANNHLIAAAPELYDALVAFSDMWGSRYASSTSKVAQQKRVELWDKVHTALAKARGDK